MKQTEKSSSCFNEIMQIHWERGKVIFNIGSRRALFIAIKSFCIVLLSFGFLIFHIMIP